jgi:hypothetical protein
MVDPRSQSLGRSRATLTRLATVVDSRTTARFGSTLTAPLVAVELSFGEEFQLACGDADILVQLHSSAVLWQKERLLNVALKSLPKACDKVAWLDCDIIFESGDCVEAASRALDEFALVHLFHERYELPMDFRPDTPNWNASLTSQSVVQKLALEEITAQDWCLTGGSLKGTSGLAWASRRELDEHGLYDACIVGGGDRAILFAALGMVDHLVQSWEMSPRSAEHYREWANLCFKRVQGRIGHIRGGIFHLWHGDLHNRRNFETHRRLFAQFDFDPFVDIVVDGNGCWLWNSDKSEMHAFVKHYFESRQEDGM